MLPYDVVFVLNRYFSEMGQAIEGAGGRLDKFIALASVVSLTDGFNAALDLVTSTKHHGVISLFCPGPGLFAIQGKEAAHNAGNMYSPAVENIFL